jgi:hypothetical protein
MHRFCTYCGIEALFVVLEAAFVGSQRLALARWGFAWTLCGRVGACRLGR